MAKAEITRWNGAPQLVIDGKPHPPMGYFMKWKDLENHLQHIRQRYDAGQRMFYLGWYLTDWAEPGISQLLLKNCKIVLDALPGDVYLGVVLNLTPPKQWVLDHPEELMVYSDGKNHPMIMSSAGVDEYPGMYSLCSDVYRKDAGIALEDMLQKLDAAPFGDRIVSVLLAGGGTAEWYYPEGNEFIDKATGTCADYSEPCRKNYSAFLQKKYGTESELRRVWKDPTATFENPKIPDLAARAHIDVDEVILDAMATMESYDRQVGKTINPDGILGSNLGVFLNVNEYQYVSDYYQSIGWGTAQTLSYLGSVVKKHSPDRLVITFYGALGCCHYYNFGTSTSTLELLESGNVDMLCSAASYNNREPGGYLAHREIQDSFLLRNTMFANEGDSRSHWTEPFYRDLMRFYKPEDTFNTYKREFAQQLCDNIQGWWYDLDNPGFTEGGMQALLKRMKEIAAFETRQDRTKHHEIALIYDQESIHYVSNDNNAMLLEFFRVTDLGRIGAPVDYYFHNDMAHPHMPDYKLYIMINVYCLSDEEREVIKAKAQRNHAMILWLYAPGFINLKTGNIMDNRNIEQTTGIQVCRTDKTLPPRFRIERNGHPALAMADPWQFYGYIDRDIHSTIWPGSIYAPPKVKAQPPAFANPFFYIPEQENIQVLGRYCLDDSIAMAMKDDGGYTSVYCCTQVLRSDLLQSLAAYAGVHLYTHNDDFICANDTLVSIHARSTGKRTLYFKAPCCPFEVYEKKFYGENITHLELDMYLGQTLTFSVRGAC